MSLSSSLRKCGNTLDHAPGEVRISTTSSLANRLSPGADAGTALDHRPVGRPEDKYPFRIEPLVQIRHILPGEGPEVLRSGHLFGRGQPDLEAVQAYLADERNVLLIAFEGTKAVGFLRATELRQLTSRRKQMFLYEIGVGEGFRRRGIGTALVNTLLEDCRERGFAEVFVLTDPANAAAVALYRATGAVTETPADRMFVYPLHPGSNPPI